MPVKRDKAGNVIDQPTEQSSTPSTEESVGYQPGKTDTGDTDSNSPYDAKTQVVRTGKPKDADDGDAAPAGDLPTQIYRGAKQPVDSTQAPQPMAAEDDAMNDPPVGWLVVVSGPGRGHYVQLGNGRNSIGRDKNERCVIDFGDKLISRSGHAIISYDARGKQFHIQGGGTNLTYINEKPILEAQILTPHTEFQIGDTTLRFVPLCNDDFDWA